jgi:nucleoside-diphosphate-sugar epimerase
MRELDPDPLGAFRAVNLDATMLLARRAVAAGVKRFIFVSSIKVNGEETAPGSRFRPDDTPQPRDGYAVSKHEAEQALLKFAQRNGLDLVIIRPPLVYGPGAKGNFARMLKWVARGVPLPLSAIRDNRRSLVCLHNLIDLIATCMAHPSAANQIFLVSDGEDLSTQDLLIRTGRVLARSPRLFYVPAWALKVGAMIVNKPDLYQRLCGSLQLDITKNYTLLGWLPPISVNEGLRRAVQG